jgi:MFS family permease
MADTWSCRSNARKKVIMMRRRGAIWLAWGICGTSLALATLTWLLHTKNAGVPLPALDEPVSVSPLLPTGMLIVFCLPAALIVSQQPRNPIGWLLATMGYSIGIGSFAAEYGFYAVWTEPGSLPGGIPALWLQDAVTASLFIGPVPLLLLLFPDGKAPSPGWRPVAWITVVAAAVLAVQSALYPRALGGDPRLPKNPTGLPSAVDTLESLGSLALVLLLLAGLASLKAVEVRFQRAKGVERQQLKWFAYGAVILVLTCIAFLPLVWSNNYLPLLVGFGLFTACITVAMLRYHLYDIDRLINRTIVYGLLTVTLTLAYVGAVFALRPLLVGSGRGGHGSLAVAGSTLAVAALFQPARRRIQAGVDQHFNRRRYNAAKTIETFNARLRQEIDLDALTAELLAVVDRTMEPVTRSLWLRPPPRHPPSSRTEAS